jgi:L-histidine Nalpha-methyltransferase
LSTFAAPVLSEVARAVACEARKGLTPERKSLSPWLFYDEAGSKLFEEITRLPEYYLTRTESLIFNTHADEIIALAGAQRCLTIAELGAGTATKTGILLRAATQRQNDLLYQPIDVSPSALDEARDSIERSIPGVTVQPSIANYITEPITLERPSGARILALYIGSSIGNFTPDEAAGVLGNLRGQLLPGDTLLLGTDLAPGKHKSEATLIDAYDDAAGVTAAFNRNVLARLNSDLAANFVLEDFRHRAVWNASKSRIEMHLESLVSQRVYIPENLTGEAIQISFEAGETIHTENSYKFTASSIDALLSESGFTSSKSFTDAKDLFAVTLATAI